MTPCRDAHDQRDDDDDRHHNAGDDGQLSFGEISQWGLSLWGFPMRGLPLGLLLRRLRERLPVRHRAGVVLRRQRRAACPAPLAAGIDRLAAALAEHRFHDVLLGCDDVIVVMVRYEMRMPVMSDRLIGHDG